MKVNAMNMLRLAAMALKAKEPMLAFSVLELSNNLRKVMRGDATLDEFRACYVGADAEPHDIDKLLPAPADAG